MSEKITDFVTMLGCRVRLTEFVHAGTPCYRLHLLMPAGDGRHAEVLLSEEDLTTLIRNVREYDER
ncbi:hypothetical protein SEA_ZAGIE_53 [Microbacterium phage Zagie]|nr:hypothetical protein SEA_ZAGIE_53 [Microbacterium phage Zagie]